MSSSNDFSFYSQGSGTLLRGRWECPSTGDQVPTVIILTGDGPKGSLSLSWKNIPPLLLEQGIASVLFDFEGLGNSEGERRNLTLSRGIENFRSAFQVISELQWIDQQRIGLFGSSFGANVALLLPDITNSAKALGLKSPASFLPDAYRNEISEDDFSAWPKQGYCASNGYDYEVYEDALRYDTYASAEKLHTPCLITHGTMDEIVPIEQSRRLYEALSGEKRLEVFEGASHGYSEEGQWQKMADMFISFFYDKLCCDSVRGVGP